MISQNDYVNLQLWNWKCLLAYVGVLIIKVRYTNTVWRKKRGKGGRINQQHGTRGAAVTKSYIIQLRDNKICETTLFNKIASAAILTFFINSGTKHISFLKCSIHFFYKWGGRTLLSAFSNDCQSPLSSLCSFFLLRRLSLRFRTSVTTRNLSLVLTSLGASSTSFRSGPGPHSFKRNSRILLSTSRLSLKRLDNLGILFASRRKVLYRSELGSQSLTVLKRSCVVICRFRRRSGLLVQAI